MLYDLIIRQNISIHQCSKRSGIPYTTLRELAYGKTGMLKCSASTLYHLSKTLNITMDDLIAPYIRWEITTSSWENYKSTLQHMLKNMGDKAFVRDVVTNMVPFYYCMKKQLRECLYLVALTDFVCRENGIVPYEGFEAFRSMKLDTPVLPADAVMAEKLGLSLDQEMVEKAIPEFRRHNIIEGEVRNVC